MNKQQYNAPAIEEIAIVFESHLVAPTTYSIKDPDGTEGPKIPIVTDPGDEDPTGAKRFQPLDSWEDAYY